MFNLWVEFDVQFANDRNASFSSQLFAAASAFAAITPLPHAYSPQPTPGVSKLAQSWGNRNQIYSAEGHLKP